MQNDGLHQAEGPAIEVGGRWPWKAPCLIDLEDGSAEGMAGAPGTENDKVHYHPHETPPLLKPIWPEGLPDSQVVSRRGRAGLTSRQGWRGLVWAQVPGMGRSDLSGNSSEGSSESATRGGRVVVGYRGSVPDRLRWW